ncbi:hypothetical protein ACH4Q7_22845 [Streptomyces roseolus]|uniref:hypothetical protein n=1 Tax=Streptomyces roseolus TaxID=67358 RepID=UPI0037A00945
MPVEPLPCGDGGGGTPVEVVTCCAPSIASAPLCRADGSTVLLVVRSGCVECGQAAPDPVAVGWIDAATGVFTPGLLPADAGPCDAGCLDTVCRQLCDDTDGDGQADATYSELWCIRADGTAEVVLTYQDDPSVPYTPVAPVDCTYGCPESETVTLCDEVGPFLRRYSFLNGTATYEDVALDGQTPHVVTGTVGVCDGAALCQAQTTPAATLGLCLADGTPIAVVVTRDCDGTVAQDGWLNLTTGTYSAGDPPAGTVACGNPRSISTTGTFCDVDPGTGDVLGLVLIEYTYGADGAVTAVRLVDATTGSTYVPQGEVTTCPAGVAQPERDLVQLCDVAADGTATEFVRDFARDENGQITGHTDYLLDGTPYAPAGTVGRCTASCQGCESFVLCDVDATPPATIAGTAASGTLANGVSWTSTASSALPPSRQGDGAAWWGVALFPNPSVPTNLWTFDQVVNVEFSVLMNWSPATGAGENQVLLPVGAVPLVLPPGYTFDRDTRILRADNTLTACTLSNPTRAAGARFRVTGVTSLSLRYLGTRAVNTECRILGHWLFGALDVSLGGEFLRTVCRDCEGAVTSATDTLLDGSTPYAPTGLVGICAPEPEECRNTSTLLLCDLPTGGNPDPAVSDRDPAPYYPYPVAAPVAGAQALWDGGTLDLPPGAGPMPGTTGRVNSLAATIQAPRPDCDTGTARVTVSVNVQQTGPDNGCGPTGHLRLFNGTTQAALTVLPVNTPTGYFGTLTAEADVPASDLAAGNIAVALALDAYDDSGGICPGARSTGWQLLAFTAATAYDQTGCDTQFLRNVVTDCESGTVTAVVDTTLDGQPYTPTGEPGQCAAAGGGSCCPEQQPCGDTEVVQLCDLTYDPQAPIPTPAGDFTLTGNVVAANGGTTLWFAQANQEANGVAELTVGGLLPATAYEFRFASAWIGAGNPSPATNNAIYLLELLDGATVLASRSRDVSQGSNVFPGGVLTEDLPPLAFIAPPSGSVTIRFTDQTTGGPFNDRDLFLMPFEVRTAALTVTSTPFLRRLTYDCDGGLTSSQDLALDGTTPYTVAGEVGQCAAAGEGSSVTVPPCDANTVVQACRCDDTDGDGIADTDYVELLGVDCEGVLTSLGTYTADLSAPYTPVAPIDCAQTDEGAGPVFGVQARRVELAAGASWDAAAFPTLQSVTAVAHGGTGTITTADGTSTLHTGEAATWSVARDADAALTGPLTIAAVGGTVTITWTQGVTL